MKFNAILIAGLTVFAASSHARTVTLDGDYGCGLLSSQLNRLDATKIVFLNSMLRAKGLETQQSKEESAKAAAEVVRISNQECRPVSGKFKVVEQRKIQGGEAIRIEPSPIESLWILGPFD